MRMDSLTLLIVYYVLLLNVERNACEKCNVSESKFQCDDIYIENKACQDSRQEYLDYIVVHPDLFTGPRPHKEVIQADNAGNADTVISWNLEVSPRLSLVRGFIVKLFEDASAAKYECRAITFPELSDKDNDQVQKQIAFRTSFNFSSPDSQATLRYLVQSNVNGWLSDILETYNATSSTLKINFDTKDTDRQLEYQVDLFTQTDSRIASAKTTTSTAIFTDISPGFYFVEIRITNQGVDRRSCPCYIQTGDGDDSRTCLMCTAVRKSFHVRGYLQNQNKKARSLNLTAILVPAGCAFVLLTLIILLVAVKRGTCACFLPNKKCNDCKSSSSLENESISSSTPISTKDCGRGKPSQDIISAVLGHALSRPEVASPYHKSCISDGTCGFSESACGHFPGCSSLSDCMVQINANYDNMTKEEASQRSSSKHDGDEAVSVGSNISV